MALVGSLRQFWERDAQAALLARLQRTEHVRDVKAFYADLNAHVDRLLQVHSSATAPPPDVQTEPTVDTTPSKAAAPPPPPPATPPTPRTPATRASRSPAPKKRRLSAKAPLIDAPSDPAAQVRVWMKCLLQEDIPEDLGEGLRNGLLLCRLANIIKPGIVAKVNPPGTPFAERDNLCKFLTAAEQLGVRDVDRFTVEDLYDSRELKQVYSCVAALADAARTAAPQFPGPFIEKPRRAS
eukprot:EG_transcript_27296